MKKNNLVLFFLIVVISGVLIWSKSFIPALRVDGAKLNVEEFYKDRDGLIQYRNLAKEHTSEIDIEQGVINSFIEDALIKAELDRRGKTEQEIDKMVEEGINSQSLSGFYEAARRLYNWNESDAKKFILFPQARKILIADEFQKENINADDWLQAKLASAKISIYLPRWKWEGGALKRRY